MLFTLQLTYTHRHTICINKTVWSDHSAVLLEATSALQEAISLVAQRIGPKKWIKLAQNLQVSYFVQGVSQQWNTGIQNYML